MPSSTPNPLHSITVYRGFTVLRLFDIDPLAPGLVPISVGSMDPAVTTAYFVPLSSAAIQSYIVFGLLSLG